MEYSNGYYRHTNSRGEVSYIKASLWDKLTRDLKDETMVILIIGAIGILEFWVYGKVGGLYVGLPALTIGIIKRLKELE